MRENMAGISSLSEDGRYRCNERHADLEQDGNH